MNKETREVEPVNRIRGVIFDADGVLLTGERIDIHLERDFGIS